MTSWTDYQDDISDAISESMDADWSASVGAKAVVAWLNEHRPISAAPAPEGGAVKPCGGCGETDPSKRCLGCFHDFQALVTREEAPAEAGDTLHPDAQPFEQYPELALHIERMAMSGVVGSMISWDAFLRELNAALQAQPPAREDALRVAVESLEWAIAEIKGDTRHANEDQREAALEKAQSTLAALQAEQGAK